MNINGDALALLLKDNTPIHIVQNELGVDYYGNILVSSEDSEQQLNILAVRLDITPELFAKSPAIGQTFECSLTGDGCVYRFISTYRSSTPLPDTIWYLTMPEFAKRTQLRDFVRVPIPLTIKVKFPGDYGSMMNYIEVDMVNISGGGICFAYPEPVNTGIPIYVKVENLPIINTLEAKMLIMRSTPIETKLGLVYHIGASLEGALNNREQERLVQSIYQLQHNYLKRGLKIPNMSHKTKN